MNNDLKIGLAFSGGGFRAAAFSLGVLTYLDRIRIGDKSLLEHVEVLSTVSGGTITGAYYALKKFEKKPLKEIYQSLYTFMRDLNLVDLGIDQLVEEHSHNEIRIRSLITAFADVYNKNLFKDAKFGEIMKDDPSFHLKHISFNATDFKTPLQFRFQWSEQNVNPKANESARGIIGNFYYKISDKIASEIRFADILAASSCFPSGFEPINFPDDFVFQSIEDIKAELAQSNKGIIGLMDGGIVDNQGIEPILLADDRINRNKYPKLMKTEYPDHALDLVIISDVASPYMKEFVASVEKPRNWWRKLTLKNILTINTLLILISIVGLYFLIPKGYPFYIILFSGIATMNLIVYFLTLVIGFKLKKVEIIHQFRHPLRKLLNLRLGVIETMLVNRIKSVLKMTGDVFLKQVRRLNYKVIYNDKTWKNRLIMNAIYELRKGEEQLEKKRNENKIPDWLYPSDVLQGVAEKAASMSTTLWFTEEELKPIGNEKSMLDALIACGQFNICWNLLEYIEKLERDHENAENSYLFIKNYKDTLIDDWNKFQKYPFWLVEEYNRIAPERQ